jgi:hypothetical protein
VATADAAEAICEVEIECLEGDAWHAVRACRGPDGGRAAAAQHRHQGAPRLSPVPEGIAPAGPCGRLARAPRHARGDGGPRHRRRGARASCRATRKGSSRPTIRSSCTRRRVAMRRMRAALRMFAKAHRAHARRCVAATAGAARRAPSGAARDWDVFITETLPRCRRRLT